MTPSLLERRKELVARNGAALERWPDRTHPEFVREMGAVTQSLKSLAEEADRAGASIDAIERARTWRYVATAHFDLGRGRERAELERAVAAFGRAEKLLGNAHEPVEAVKLAYCFGEALLCLAEAKGMDIQLAQRARDCFARAIPLARTHMREGLAQLAKRQRDAESVISLLTQVDKKYNRAHQQKPHCHHHELGNPWRTRSYTTEQIKEKMYYKNHPYQKKYKCNS